MARRNNSHRAYLARESRRQGKTAGRFLVGFFVFAALYNMGSHSKAAEINASGMVNAYVQDKGTARGVSNLPGHPDHAQMVCARPPDPNEKGKSSSCNVLHPGAPAIPCWAARMTTNTTIGSDEAEDARPYRKARKSANH